MNIFIAGGSGAIGRVLVPMLVAEGHRVTAMTRSGERAAMMAAGGATAVVGDVYDAARLNDVVGAARPDIVLHQLTAFGTKNGDPLAETIRIRIEGTRNLVAAAKAAGAKRFIAQSIAFICIPEGEGLTDEKTPLFVDGPPAIRPLAQAVAELERQTLQTGLEAAVLRYGWFYGPGTNYDPAGPIPTALREGRMSIAGEGKGVYSFIDLSDAARATMAALAKASGIYAIVDDHPAPMRDWAPEMARLLGAPMPQHIDEAIARQKLGDLTVYFMNEQRGVSNAKAKRELGWRPQTASWREGFARLYAGT